MAPGLDASPALRSPREVDAAHPIARLAALAAPALLSGCAGMIGAQAGAVGLATPRGHTPVAATANLHGEIGVAPNAATAVLAGFEMNLRATRDYGHGDAGATLGVLGQGERVMLHARLGLDPLGFSLRDATAYFAPGAGLELGGGFRIDSRQHHGRFITETEGNAITLSVRSDAEWRPAEGRADVFVGAMVGFAWVGIVSR